MIWDIAAYIGNIGTVRTFYTVLQNPVLYGTWELEPYGGIRCTMSNYQMPFSIISDRENETSWSNYNHDLLSVPITVH